MIELGAIQLIEFINHPPAKVWAALTEPELHAKWWAAGDIFPRIGHRFTLDMGPWGPQICRVSAVVPERLLCYSFAPETLNTTITWRLMPQENGTRLLLEHRGFDLSSPTGEAAFQGMNKGWPQILERIEPMLSADTGKTATVE